MKNLKLMTSEETSKINGGGALRLAASIFIAIVMWPTRSY
jgi:hypothetical protein